MTGGHFITGVIHGAQAQEEDLCRSSSLAPVLFSDRIRELYYEPNVKLYEDKSKSLLERYSDNVLYSCGICVFRDDMTYEFLDTPYQVDVITCAAPVDEQFMRTKKAALGKLNMYAVQKENETSFPDAEAFVAAHELRAKRSFVGALDHGAKILVLGAIGCGAFYNNHCLVGRAWGNVIRKYGGLFDKIYYAVYDPDARMEVFVNTLLDVCKGEL